MKTAMKKVFSLMLVAVLLVGVMPFQAFAAVNYQIEVQIDSSNKLTFTLTDETNTTIYLTDDQVAEVSSAIAGKHIRGWQLNGSGNVVSIRSIGFTGNATVTAVKYNTCPCNIYEDDTTSVHTESTCPLTLCEQCSGTLMNHDADCPTLKCGKCGNAIHDASIPCCSLCKQTGHDDGDNHCAVCKWHEGHNTGCSNTPCDDCNGTLGNHDSDCPTRECDKCDGTLGNHDSDCPTRECDKCDGTLGSHDSDCPIRECDECDGTLSNHDSDCPHAMCTECFLNNSDCVCCDQCDGTTIEHDKRCPLNERESSRGKTKLTLDYNYRGARSTTMDVERRALLADVVAGIPAPTREGHQFKYWTLDAAGNDPIDKERVPEKGTTIYAQWADDLALDGDITILVNLNYEDRMDDALENIAKGTRMGDVLDYIDNPTRRGFTFVGWYWDARGRHEVDAHDKVTKDCEIYAKWERGFAHHEIALKIYINGNTKTPAKVVDMHDYAHDGRISMSEVKEVVLANYTAKDSNGLSYDGLYNASTWKTHRHGENTIMVSNDTDTIVHVVVNNVKTSSATADSSNPKTGDMIMTPVIVLGASAACLAALFFLNKKRAV